MQEQLQQIMNYRDAEVYQAYINKWVQCDMQVTFLEHFSFIILFKTVTHISHYIDL